MKRHLAAGIAVLVLSLALVGNAFGFDCIRVSSSLQGRELISE